MASGSEITDRREWGVFTLRAGEAHCLTRGGKWWCRLYWHVFGALRPSAPRLIMLLEDHHG